MESLDDYQREAEQMVSPGADAFMGQIGMLSEAGEILGALENRMYHGRDPGLHEDPIAEQQAQTRSRAWVGP